MATIEVVSGWAGVSDVQQEGFRLARQKQGRDAQIYLCFGTGGGCSWWGWGPKPHYNPDGAGAKHGADLCFKPDRLGVAYVVLPCPSIRL